MGHTVHPLKDRIREHLNAIEKGDLRSPIGKHFSLCSKRGVFDLGVKVIEKVHTPYEGVIPYVY